MKLLEANRWRYRRKDLPCPEGAVRTVGFVMIEVSY
jgi:hypothetical protein